MRLGASGMSFIVVAEKGYVVGFSDVPFCFPEFGFPPFGLLSERYT
jgi:hypothetical protein